MKVESPLGDIVDRMTILQLKVERLPSPAARTNAERELHRLRSAWRDAGQPPLPELPEAAELARVNGALWAVEDELRDHEARQDFGEHFVERARSVYHLNDERAALKRALNLRLGSDLVEEKSYGRDPS